MVDSTAGLEIDAHNSNPLASSTEFGEYAPKARCNGVRSRAWRAHIDSEPIEQHSLRYHLNTGPNRGAKPLWRNLDNLPLDRTA